MNSVKLGEICELHYGKGLQGYQDNEPTNAAVRVFGTNGPIGWTTQPLVDQPTIIIGRKGAYRGVHFSDIPSWTIDTAYFLTLKNDDIDLKWLYYRLLLLDINRMDTGAAIPSTKREDFYAAKVNIPSPLEQVRIANILSAYDALIENNRRRIQLLEEAARLLYREWFVHLRFPGHEHAAVVDGVPEGWERNMLGELLTLQRGFDLPLSQRKEGSSPIYASTGINGFHSEAKVVGPGVVTGRSGTLGTVMYVPGDFWPLNTTLWVKEFKKVGPHFAVHLLDSLHLEQYNGGVAVPTLNRNDVHRIEVLSPSGLLLQLFEEHVSALEKQKTILQRTNEQAGAARDLLLPRLMNGELAV